MVVRFPILPDSPRGAPTTLVPTSYAGYRPDIDGLRALAVLSVVLYHAFPDHLRGGFIGVDIFFVISGYLISTIILEHLQNDTFSFRTFYARRIRRILPALLLVVTTCLIIGWFLLLPSEYSQLGTHIAAGLGFILNFVLWSEAGYFDNASETKPLLHLWSLAVEEQFYILWPFILWFAWRKRLNILAVILILGAVSLYLNLTEIRKDLVGAFYSPQTRFWELMAGSFLAWINVSRTRIHDYFTTTGLAFLRTIYDHTTRKHSIVVLANLSSALGLSILAYAIHTINSHYSFPGYWALLPVTGTALIIFSGPAGWLNRTLLSSNIAVWFGLISYPLYLWHWPLLSFTMIDNGGYASAYSRILLILLSVALAWLTYRFLEVPIRFRKPRRFFLAAFITFGILVGTLGYAASYFDGFDYRRPPNIAWDSYGDMLAANGPVCAPKPITEYPGVRGCAFGSTEPTRTVFLYGDSHAGALSHALNDAFIENHIKGFRVSASGCAVIPTVRNIYQPGDYSGRCPANFASLLRFISNHGADIIVAARWSFRLYPIEGEIEDMPYRNSEGGRESERYRQYAVIKNDQKAFDAASKQSALDDFISNILSTELKVHFVYPIPEIGWNIARLNYKHFNSTRTLLQDISIPHTDFIERNRFVHRVFHRHESNPSFIPIRPESVFCDSFISRRCAAQHASLPFYLDDDHLSYAGAKLVSNLILSHLPNP